MVGDLLLLSVGLVFLLGGGEALVRGATAIASATGVPHLVVGLTIVAFGTSAPELAVNVWAAWRDSGALSFGNIFGSNMANIGLVLGVAGLLRPLRIQSVIIFREIPMMMVATAAAVILSLDLIADISRNEFSRTDGLLLLLLFCVFLYYTVGDLARQRSEPGAITLSVGDELASVGLFRSVLIMLAGLGALLAGAEFTVDAALSLALAMGMPEAIIGLTLVAIGTSLPELVTAVIATLRGHIDLAVGNVVGSNIFNILLVGGITATIRPIPVPPLGFVDLAMTVLLSLLLWFMATTRRRRIVRVEAVVLISIYVGYLAWRMLTSPNALHFAN
ncbi:MAG: calcium/sodium antiporter [Proteobacteria bacterium]|nr:calcium/sodium antiporter [Pseudomonadota bacterium]